MRWFLFLFSCLGTLTASAATSYYIDFKGGNNDADGLTPESAWKHSPGDTRATGLPAQTELEPGDTLHFKGGVRYFGEISVNATGSADAPIRFDGNSDGSFGNGRAILDGARVITNWKRCESAEDAGGNPLWRSIRFADLDVDMSSNFNHDSFVPHRDAKVAKQAPWQRLFLVDGDRRVLPIAQLPKPSDPFFPDIPADFYRVSNPVVDLNPDEADSPVLIKDRERLSQHPAEWYEDLFVGLHGGNNHVYFAPLKGFDPLANALKLPHFPHRRYPTTQYALYNSPRLLEQPGEWCLVAHPDQRTRVLLMDNAAEEGERPKNIGYPALKTAITLENNAAHIEIVGFLIQRYAGGSGGIVARGDRSRSPQQIRIADCELRFISGRAAVDLNYTKHVEVENCYIHHCPGWTVGIYVNRTERFRLRNNRLDSNSGSGIRHYAAKHGHVTGNVLTNHFGIHSSSVNLYVGSEDILFQNNRVNNTIAINRNARNLRLVNNVADGLQRTTFNLAIWTSGSTGGTVVENVLLQNNTLVNTDPDISWSSSIYVAKENDRVPPPHGLVLKRNIIERLHAKFEATLKKNIFLNLPPAGLMGESDRHEASPETIFVDYENGDYRRAADSLYPESGAQLTPDLTPECNDLR